MARRWRQIGSVGWLSLLLLVSGALNVAAGAALFWRSSPQYSWRPAEPIATQPLGSNLDLIEQFRHFSQEQMVQKLLSELPVEDGLCERDLALACLVAFHDFDLCTPLGHPPRDVRSVDQTIDLFPGLSQKQWDAISDFALTEEWPLTARGLFCEMKRGIRAPSLTLAFSLTPHFRAVELLFSRARVPATRAELLALVVQGSWELLSQFTEEQRLCQELSDERRRDLLLAYLKADSPQAANLLLRLDGPYLVQFGGDGEVISLLDHLQEPSAEGHAFALELLERPRSRAVWDAAASLLKRWRGGEEPPTQVATHLVEKGDSLWILAEKYNCTVADLMEANSLESETIRPGQTLNLP